MIKKILRRIKPLVKLNKWLQYQFSEFNRFQNRIHNQTWKRHDEILAWADSCINNRDRLESQEAYSSSMDAVVRQGYELKNAVEREYKDKYSSLEKLRILVHVPDYRQSVAGHSIFKGMAKALSYLGISVDILGWDDAIEPHLERFKPTILITSDKEPYLEKINWPALEEYRKHAACAVGLTASLEEYGNTALANRLKWAREHHVAFYYSWFPWEYIGTREEYRPFFEEGYKIHSVEFGANPLLYYPVPGIERDLLYVFLGSRNRVKWSRYFTFFDKLLRDYPGYIHGGGWSKIKNQTMNTERDHFLYARARVGINLHTAEEVRWARECNERTYMLAACGAPQLIDNPKLLPSRFPEGCFFTAATPEEYYEQFRFILDNPEEAQRRALKAQQEVFSRYTTFHRLERFLLEIGTYCS